MRKGFNIKNKNNKTQYKKVKNNTWKGSFCVNLKGLLFIIRS